MKNKAMTAVIIAIVLAGLIQLVPVNRINPPGPDTFDAPPEVKEIIKRSCYDCHSNETVWPSYSRIAPFSWIVAHDVHEAREEVNFTEWANLSPKKRTGRMLAIAEEIEEGAMPLPKYLMLHKDAKLTNEQKQTIIKWASAGAKESGKGEKEKNEKDH